MWHRFFPRFCGRFFFSAIRVRGAEHIPPVGPVLWLGLHRNGAVDGFAYAAALQRPIVFMISTQLRKSFFARLFFDGIAVARNSEEGDRSANRAALADCMALLRGGGELFVFPEGTSSLGPRHLPFKAGAAQLALDWLDAGHAPASLQVIPVGIHYDAPEAFRSAVEVVVGERIDLSLPPELATLGRLRELKRRMTVALESVGVNFADEHVQRDAEAVATLAAGVRGQSRFAMLKACERGVPPALSAAWRELETAAASHGTVRYHGVPLWGPESTDEDAASTEGGTFREVLLLGPLVLAGIALNAPPWLAATAAGKKFPDDRNVIALWKILVGVPAFFLWASLLTVVLLAKSAWLAVGLYWLLTWIAWAGYDRVKCAGVQLRNGLRGRRQARPAFTAMLAKLGEGDVAAR